MSESFICRRGGVGTPFAVIGVTYPEGSTCTCTDGAKTLTAKGTSGRAIFNIPYAATWTVTCTNGTDTASQAVSITAEGQSESVELSYALVLIGGGSTHEDVTGSWVSNKTEYTISTTAEQLKITGAAGGLTGYVYADGFDPSALKDYSTVVMTYTLESQYSIDQRTFKLEVASAKTSGTVAATTGTLDWTSAATTVTLDISSVNSGYIRFLCGQTADPGFIITNLKLTH